MFKISSDTVANLAIFSLMALFTGSMIYLAAVTEIDDYKYNEINKIIQHNPNIKQKVKEMMADSYISNYEFNQIFDLSKNKMELKQILKD